MKDLSQELFKIAASLSESKLEEDKQKALYELDDAIEFVAEYADRSSATQDVEDVVKHWFNESPSLVIQEFYLGSLSKTFLVDLALELDTPVAIITALDKMIKKDIIEVSDLHDRDRKYISGLHLTSLQEHELRNVSWLSQVGRPRWRPSRWYDEDVT